MGKLSLLLTLAVAITFGIHSFTVSERGSAAIENYVSYNSEVTARNINHSTLELGLKRLADSAGWRAGYKNLSLLGGQSNLTVRDTIVGGKKVVAVRCVSVVNQDTVTSQLLIKAKLMPPVVRAAITAFGPLDKAISDMYIDGRDHTDKIISTSLPHKYELVPGAGYFGISTGAPSFTNSQNGNIGGTDRTTNPWLDIVPSFPNNPKTIETSSSWPNGFPKTPDAAMGWPEGTLIGIAKSGQGGSRYITTRKQLDSLAKGGYSLDGVTFIHVPDNDNQWKYNENNILPDNSAGILVFHSDNGKAFWDRVEYKGREKKQVFKGLAIFDNVFHIHINILGALVILTPNTVTNEECPLNNELTVALSSQVVEKYVGKMAPKLTGGWRDKLMLLSWFEN